MSSIQELIAEITSIKRSSDDLAVMIGMANTGLTAQSTAIAAIVQGSRTGAEAVMSLSIAARSLANAASSMKALSRACDDCLSALTK